MNTLDTLFSWFTETTVRGSLLALAVLCIQAALHGRMPARWRYALWLPVIFVLVAPILPQSRWSIENRINPRTSRTQLPVPDTMTESIPDWDDTPAKQSAPLPSSRFDWRRAAQVTWLTGACGLLGFALAAYARTMRRIRRGMVAPDDSLKALVLETTLAVGLRRTPQLLVSTGVRSPAVTGLLRPMLLLPAEFPGVFTRDEARLVLLHELTHLKRQDLPLNWLLCFIQAIHWCNPLLWFVFARIRADREAACDAQVLATSENDCRADYGHALLKLEDGPMQSGLSLGFLGIFEHAAGLRSRIRGVAAYRQAHPVWSGIGIVIIAALLMVGGTRAQDPVAADDARKPLGADQNLERQRAAKLRIQAKLQRVVPQLEFRETSVREALDFLRVKSVELDVDEPDPAQRGVNFVVNLGQADGRVPDAPKAGFDIKPADARITISLRNIPLLEALKYVTNLAGLKFAIEEHGVRIVPINAPFGPLAARTFNLSKDNVADLRLEAGKDATEILALLGVEFPAGTSATVSANGRQLIVRNSAEQLNLIDALLTPKITADASAPPSGRDLVRRKLNSLIVPRIEFKDATLREILDVLRRKSVELDTTENDPAKKGVAYVLKLEGPGAGAAPPQAIPGLEAIPGAGAAPAAATISNQRMSISLQNVSLMEVIRQVAASAKLRFRIENHAVAVMPMALDGALQTKEWKVKPDTLAAAQKNGETLIEFLKGKGITFPEGAQAVFIPAASRLVMRNTEENLDRLDDILAASLSDSK
jgi:bla regulator protein blaR1